MKNATQQLVKCFIAIAFCFNTTIAEAQNSYEFQATQAAYSDLEFPTDVPWSAFDPSTNAYTLLGLNSQTVYFYNLPFTFDGIKTIAIQPNGNLRIDNDSSLIIIDAAFTYLDSIDSGSSISYVIDGPPGNYVLKCQWKNLMVRVGQANNFVNLQIWVYQASNVIEIHYGPRSANNASGFNTTSGPQVGMFYSRDNFTLCYEKLWITGAPTNFAVDSAANYSFLAMSGVPDSGTVYRFIPRFGSTQITEIAGIEMIEIFPNPTGEYITINVKEDKSGYYKILDATGKIVKSGSISDQSTTINLSEVQSGVYMFVMENGEKKYSKTFVKK
jgi:hypothetical protein